MIDNSDVEKNDLVACESVSAEGEKNPTDQSGNVDVGSHDEIDEKSVVAGLSVTDDRENFSKLLNDQLVYYLSYGVSLAGILQLFFLYKFVSKHYSLKFNLKFNFNNKVKIFFKKLLPSIFSSGVTQINILVGTIIASFQASAVSYLYYADRIYQINLAIAGIAIGVVILPQLSKHIQSKKKDKILLIQNKALELSLFLSLPASVALLIGSEEINPFVFLPLNKILYVPKYSPFSYFIFLFFAAKQESIMFFEIGLTISWSFKSVESDDHTNSPSRLYIFIFNL